MASLDHFTVYYVRLSKYCPLRIENRRLHYVFDFHNIPDNNFCGRLIINLSWTLRPCTKQRNISCKHLRTKVHLASPSKKPPYKASIYPPHPPISNPYTINGLPHPPSPPLTSPPSNKFSDDYIYNDITARVIFIWQVCEVTVYLHCGRHGDADRQGRRKGSVFVERWVSERSEGVKRGVCVCVWGTSACRHRGYTKILRSRRLAHAQFVRFLNWLNFRLCEPLHMVTSDLH